MARWEVIFFKARFIISLFFFCVICFLFSSQFSADKLIWITGKWNFSLTFHHDEFISPTFWKMEKIFESTCYYIESLACVPQNRLFVWDRERGGESIKCMEICGSVNVRRIKTVISCKMISVPRLHIANISVSLYLSICVSFLFIHDVKCNSVRYNTWNLFGYWHIFLFSINLLHKSISILLSRSLVRFYFHFTCALFIYISLLYISDRLCADIRPLFHFFFQFTVMYEH